MPDIENNIIGCFVSELADDDQGAQFRSYIWSRPGIAESLKSLKYDKYGEDLKLILFKFYVNPIPYQLSNLKPLENYRKVERSIAAVILITKDNFFQNSESDRKRLIFESIMSALDSINNVVKTKKLDTKIDLLKSDVEEIFKKEQHL